jgi:molybdate transport system permease protein
LRGYISAAVLGFAHTIGEFGVVLMVGGSIPGQTKVLSTTIFDHVETMEFAQAHTISACMLIFSFLVLLGVYVANRRFPIHAS